MELAAYIFTAIFFGFFFTIGRDWKFWNQI